MQGISKLEVDKKKKSGINSLKDKIPYQCYYLLTTSSFLVI